MNISIYIDKLDVEILPAYCNYTLTDGMKYDAISNTFVEPYLPNHKIGIIHLAGLSNDPLGEFSPRLTEDINYSGTINLAGKEIDGPGVERGMVFQQGALFEWLTVTENVNFGLRMKKEDPITTAKKVDEWLDIVGLQGFGNTPTYQLSGGMQQRVALARCLINDPELILMDEPLGALDALTREKMQSLVLKIWKETGKTIILITHSVEEALLLGEKLYVMAPRPGRIHKEYKLPFATMGLDIDLREIKNNEEFVSKREEILTMIWDMEEEIMGKEI